MISRTVLVLGQGVAAICVARLLTLRGWQVQLRGHPLTRSSPRIILNAITTKLLSELFEIHAADFLTKYGAISIESRAIAQGNRGSVEVLPHHGISITALNLANALRDQPMLAPPLINARHEKDFSFSHEDIAAHGWVIDARGKAASPDRRLSLGQRRAIVTDVELADNTPHGRCWMETTPTGWMFLLPGDIGQGTLQIVVPNLPCDALSVAKKSLASSSLISRFVTRLLNSPTVLEAAPSMSLSIGTEGFIRIGDAAISFDPICGDGTGNAVRSAILASAVLDAVASGVSCDQGLRYYRWRLMQTFVHHIQFCDSFYRQAFSSAAWASELREASEAGFSISSELSHSGEPEFRLKGLDLVPV